MVGHSGAWGLLVGTGSPLSDYYYISWYAIAKVSYTLHLRMSSKHPRWNNKQDAIGMH
jgi:hypothetical protein